MDAPTVEGKVLEGTDCDEVIVAPPGVTEIDAGGGDDRIFATPGVSVVTAGSGDDLIVGTGDVAFIDAGAGDDRVFGEDPPFSLPTPTAAIARVAKMRKRRPTLYVEPASCTTIADTNNAEEGRQLTSGSDICTGRDENQLIDGGPGNDYIWGGRGNDRLYGGTGGDRLFGSVGDDFISGEEGNDRLGGGNGSDNMLGGADHDYIHGDTVGDVRKYDALSTTAGLSGGSGTDTISFATAIPPGFTDKNKSPYAWGTTLNGDFAGFPAEGGNRGVYVDLVTVRPQNMRRADNGGNRNGGGEDEIVDDFENVVGSPFADVIVGNERVNKIWGGGGGDVILGMGGSDYLYGGADGDFIDGGPDTEGDTTVSGGGPPAASTDLRNVDICVKPTGESVGSDCEKAPATAGSPRSVQQPDSNYINVGLMSPIGEGSAAGMSLYVTGSSIRDDIWVKFEPNINWTSSGQTAQGTVRITRSSTSKPFNIPNATANGCSDPTNPDVPGLRCPIATWGEEAFNTAPTATLFGGTGSDYIYTNLDINNSEERNFPFSATKVIVGGEDDDYLKGDNSSEDILIDGNGIDKLFGYARSDVVFATEGKDEAHGNQDGDVLYATRTCEDNLLDGGEGTDNVTWAAWSPTADPGLPQRSETNGVFARLSIVGGEQVGTVGARLGQTDPACTSPGVPDDLTDVENLEGTGGKDKLIGDSGPNTLLGRNGADEMYGNGGGDVIIAHSNDYEDVIDCGGQGSDDELHLDFQRGDKMDEATTQNCVGAPRKSFFTDGPDPGSVPDPYPGNFPEYDGSLDIDISTEINSPGETAPLAHYQLGERYGDQLFESRKVPTGGGVLDLTGRYYHEDHTNAEPMNPKEDPQIPSMTQDSAIPNTPDLAHSFDGVDDYASLNANNSPVDPYFPNTDPSVFDPRAAIDPTGASISGYTLETWARFREPAAGSFASGNAQYLFSKTDLTNGISLYREIDPNDDKPHIVFRVDNGTGTPLIVSRPQPVDPPGHDGWHHYTIMMANSPKDTNGNYTWGFMVLYIDGDPGTPYVIPSSVFPTASNTSSAKIGIGHNLTGDHLPADVDNLVIFRRTVQGCQIARQVALHQENLDLPPCPP